MQTQTQKKGRGRPKGSNSFVTVSLADLNSMFNGADQIQVGRLWLQNSIKTEASVVQNDTPAQTQETPKVEMSLSE